MPATQPPRLSKKRNLGGFFMPGRLVVFGGPSMPENYQKPALTFSQQLSLLQQRGLVVSDKASALRQLSAISYYRLSAYWYPFRQRDGTGNILSNFVPDTEFNRITNLYEFDRKLRLLVMDALERVEVAVRTQITYHFGHTYGAFGHTDPGNFHAQFKHAVWLSKLEDETSRSSDEFIRHYQSKYDGFPRIPVWMLTEVMSFGALSFFYKGLRNDRRAGIEDKKLIADYFQIHHKRLGDWLHTLTYVRNVCAHHSRLWNRELAIRPDNSKLPEWRAPWTPRNDRIFYILLILRHLLRASGNGDEWACAVSQLMEPFADCDAQRCAMGMPENWKEHPVWK